MPMIVPRQEILLKAKFVVVLCFFRNPRRRTVQMEFAVLSSIMSMVETEDQCEMVIAGLVCCFFLVLVFFFLFFCSR